MRGWPGFLKGDRVLWIISILLSLISILAVYSSTGTLAFKYKGGNTEYFVIKHVLILLSGFIIMYVVHNIPYSFFSRISNLLFYTSIVLLVITIFRGTSYNEALRWLTIPGINISFQASDVAKFSLIVYLAKNLAVYENQITNYQFFLKKFILPVVVVSLLILPSNFSTAALILVVCMLVIFTSTIPLKNFFYTSGLLLATLLIAILILYALPNKGRVETWKSRIESFVKYKDDLEKNYQSLQAKIAIASGGMFGKMPGNSSQKSFLPNPFSDFIYAFIAEEYGIWGPMIILVLYLILLYRTIVIARKNEGRFGIYMSLGIGFMLFLQAMINMGVSVGIFPVTGQPLPLVSMGGTSIWFTCLSLGIILNISQQNQQEQQNEEHYEIPSSQN
ncbi:MAG: FtsW/RodA/SpoVE family cell cycle protein [Bacteroidales bacterium]|nr:FtsW/RodA/SpoVE family cell cycle protein [Bacteroidales bacterium]